MITLHVHNYGSADDAAEFKDFCMDALSKLGGKVECINIAPDIFTIVQIPETSTEAEDPSVEVSSSPLKTGTIKIRNLNSGEDVQYSVEGDADVLIVNDLNCENGIACFKVGDIEYKFPLDGNDDDNAIKCVIELSDGTNVPVRFKLKNGSEHRAYFANDPEPGEND